MTNIDTAGHGLNDTRDIKSRDDLDKAVRAFGRASASGKDALPMLAIAVVRAANDGLITAAKVKGQTDAPDDAAVLYDEYAIAEGKKAVHEHTANGKKANVSKLRTMIKMGEMTTCDGVDVLNRAVVIREELRASDADIKSAYPAYVDVARSQLKLDRALTDDELVEAILKKEQDEPTLEKELVRIAKSLEKLITGENKYGLMDQSEETITAHEMLTKRIAAFVVERETAAFMEKAAALGFDVKAVQTAESEAA